MILKSYNLLRINSEYKTNKNTIYVEKDNDEVILTKLISSYVDLSIDGEKLIVKYNDTVIITFNLSRVNEIFNVKDYKVNNDKYTISGIIAGTNINYEIIDINGNVIKGEAYLDAADYNSDGSIKMNDVIRMLKERS